MKCPCMSVCVQYKHPSTTNAEMVTQCRVAGGSIDTTDNLVGTMGATTWMDLTSWLGLVWFRLQSVPHSHFNELWVIPLDLG